MYAKKHGKTTFSRHKWCHPRHLGRALQESLVDVSSSPHALMNIGVTVEVHSASKSSISVCFFFDTMCVVHVAKKTNDRHHARRRPARQSDGGEQVASAGHMRQRPPRHQPTVARRSAAHGGGGPSDRDAGDNHSAGARTRRRRCLLTPVKRAARAPRADRVRDNK